MIGTQKTGRLPGIVISKVTGGPVTLTIDGKPGVLAVLSADGSIVASSADVAREVAAVCVECYRSMVKGKGHVRVWSDPIAGGVLISQVAHEWPTVTIAGQPGSFAVLTADGIVVASGANVAAEVLSVSVNCYRDMLIARGFLRVMSPPQNRSTAQGVHSTKGGAA